MSPVQTVTYLSGSDNWENGGEGGIRTHGTLSRTAVFKTAALNHSATSPCRCLGGPAVQTVSFFSLGKSSRNHQHEVQAGEIVWMCGEIKLLWDVPAPLAHRGRTGSAGAGTSPKGRGRRSGVVGRVLNRRPKLEVGSSIAVTGRSSAMSSP